MSVATVARTLLEPLGYPVHDVAAAKVTQQYIVLDYVVHNRDPETTPGGDVGFAAPFRVKARAATAEAVGIMLKRIRAALVGTRTGDAGQWVTFTFEQAEFIADDPDHLDPATNLPPFYGVDSYTVRSEPQ